MLQIQKLMNLKVTPPWLKWNTPASNTGGKLFTNVFPTQQFKNWQKTKRLLTVTAVEGDSTKYSLGAAKNRYQTIKFQL